MLDYGPDKTQSEAVAGVLDFFVITQPEEKVLEAEAFGL